MPKWILVFGLILAIGGAWLWWSNWQFIAPPSYVCSLPEAEPCQHTGFASTFWYVPGRPVKVELVPAADYWAPSAGPDYGEPEWAARIDRFMAEPIVAACFYSFGDQVSCYLPGYGYSE